MPNPKQYSSKTRHNKPRRKDPSKPLKSAPHVRLMAPFGMICNECSNAIYKATKFNAKKRSTDKEYLGIKILSFEIRCPQCSGQILFETDPKTSGYALVSGAHRILDLHRKKATESETADEKIKRMAGTEQQQDKLEKLATSAQHNIEEARRDQEVDELQRLVQLRRRR